MGMVKFKDITPFGVRFPTELKAKLQKAAHRNTRSMNAEIVARIAESFDGRNDLKEFSDGELIDELSRRLGSESVHIELTLKVRSPEENILQKYKLNGKK